MITFIEKNEDNVRRISPNCIKNRFDLQGAEDFDLIQYKDRTEELVLMVKYENITAYPGLYLVPVSEKALKKIIKFIFKKKKKIRYLVYETGYCSIGNEAVQTNHFRIDLPEDSESLQARLSKKGRYNIAREKRILEQEFGSWSVKSYPASASEAKAVLDRYFEYKSVTHGERWKNTNHNEYCKKYGVSTVYALTLGEEENIVAVILSCEECPVVYIDNITYASDLAKYSLGQILYDEYLKILISKGVKELFLLGGNYSYKKRYGSREETVYNCRITKNPGMIKLKVFVWNTLVKLKIIKR